MNAIIAILSIGFALAAAAPPAISVKEFKATTGLEDGRYTYSNQPVSECQIGELSIYAIQGDDVVVRLGSSPLLVGIRKSPFDYKDDAGNCVLHFKGSFSKGKVDVTRNEICKGADAVTTRTEVQVKGDHITYKQTWSAIKPGAKVSTVTCSIRREKI